MKRILTLPELTKLLAFLKKYLPWPARLSGSLLRFVRKDEVNGKKNVIWHRPGDRVDRIYWLENGYARLYTIEEDEDGFTWQVTLAFWKPGSIIRLDGFCNPGKKMAYYLELSRQATLYNITQGRWQRLRSKQKGWDALAARLLDDMLSATTQREMLLKEPADVRYQLFLEEYGVMIEEYMYLENIASYLGFDPSTLSRLRG